jgi:hypothetical protein
MIGKRMWLRSDLIEEERALVCQFKAPELLRQPACETIARVTKQLAATGPGLAQQSLRRG